VWIQLNASCDTIKMIDVAFLFQSPFMWLTQGSFCLPQEGPKTRYHMTNTKTISFQWET
jgi:hypothetical protein